MKTAAFFKEKREKKGASLREIGRAAGISHVHVARLEKGERTCTLEVCNRLLKALGTTWPEFLSAIGYLEEEPARYKAAEKKKPYKPRKK